jgi:hypothetical protein
MAKTWEITLIAGLVTPRNGQKGHSVSGAGDRSRTYDLLITNELLYQLSYTGTGREW